MLEFARTVGECLFSGIRHVSQLNRFAYFSSQKFNDAVLHFSTIATLAYPINLCYLYFFAALSRSYGRISGLLEDLL